jgi:prepilin signal peptidase PulO-like enzyme (type II secretory pathway)
MLRALRLCAARVRREFVSLLILLMAVFGAAAIAACWLLSGPNWDGLLTALVGMAAGGGIVWVVRIVGSAAMPIEAMGFGDVTLMAMIGAFVGWQPCFIIFFLAPFAALAVGLLRLILFRQREIPFGPFLCLPTLALIVFWDSMWQRTQNVFTLGWILPVIVLVICCVLMPILLFGMRILFRR